MKKDPGSGGSDSPGRRAFLGKLTALGATSAMGISSLAARQNPFSATNGPDKAGHPRSSDHLLIKGGYVLSMDREIGDLPVGDVHLHGEKIINVGKNIHVEGAEVIDGSGMIVMPGMLDTHWHVWTSVLRAMAGAKDGVGYFDITSTFGRLFAPQDMYVSTRLAGAEAVYSGITFVHDWCHNVRSLDHAAASINALRDSGLRSRFAVGLPAGANQEKDRVDMSILEHLLRKQTNQGNNDLVSLGLAWPEAGTDLALRLPELEAARKWGLPVSLHAGRKPDGADSITKVKDYLGSDMQVIHGVRASEKDLKLLVDAGASLSISPYSELRIGYGFPPIPEMLSSGVDIGLSVDTFPLSGNADMFAVMKVFLNLANGMSEDEFLVSGKRILELATIEGARSMGMDHLIGSISPGKCADIIMIDTQTPNMVPFTDPVMLLVTAAQPANVDTVIIDGKILKRKGQLVTTDTEDIFRQSTALVQRLKKEAGW